MRFISTTFVGLLAVCGVFAQEPKFVPPPPERISALLEFSKPVPLALRVSRKEELERKPRRGVPRVAYSYSAPAHTSQSFSIAVYSAGGFLGERRAELTDWLASESGRLAAGVSRASDGRSIVQFPMGFGPGGEAEGALLVCRNPKYEIIVVQQTDYHEDEDRKLFTHHVKPQKKMREIIEAIEALVMP